MAAIQGENHEEDFERALISGCFFGDIYKVRLTILRNPWINLNDVRTESEKTLLMLAYTKGHANIMRSLFSEGGIDSTCRDWQGRAILSIVNQNGVVAPEAFIVLVESHCAINKQDADRLLEYACTVNDVRLVRFILTLSYTANSAFITIRESFQRACRDGYVEIVTLMLARPGLITADVLNDRRNEMCRTVAYTSDSKLLSVLLTRQDLQLNLVDAQQQSPLHIACTEGLLDLVKCLLMVGNHDTLLIQDKDGNSPLYSACSRGHVKIVRYILENPLMKGDCLKMFNHEGQSLLLVAILNDHVDVCALLLNNVQQHADDLNIILHGNNAQQSALPVAASKGLVPVLQTLLNIAAWSAEELHGAREAATVGNHKNALQVLGLAN